MKVVGSALLGAPRAQVWAALQDPAVLVRTIPGCERLEAVGDEVYKMTVSAGVASVKGVYQGEVALTDPEEPERFVLRARGQGTPGTVDATVQVRLSEVDGGTRVDYDADAVVGGMIGGVGQRMLGSVAKRTAGEFFSAVESAILSADETPAQEVTVVHGMTPVAGATAGHGAAAPTLPVISEDELAGIRESPTPPPERPTRPVQSGQVFTRPPKPRKEGPSRAALAAFALGAFIALVGVLVGYLIARA
ncbi:carbon monoxide dehydrogenase subunit G [Streptosporangiaceae bacterium NEAU-GS5]|nr:carbon monoxide dehydrogenase subunit G [Streptosporangiaceae bacterium NEAU-GS5]